MASIWERDRNAPVYAPLDGDRSVDVLVIGGGMAGILAAYEIQCAGREVLVLEAERVGSGQTGRTTGKITAQHGLYASSLLRAVGLERARAVMGLHQRAVARYGEIIAQEGIRCGYCQQTAFVYNRQDARALSREALAAEQLGIPARLYRELPLPFAVAGAVAYPGQAQFHPLQFLDALASRVPVCEHTRVRRIVGHVAQTNRGDVTARKIVVATHYPIQNRPGYYFLRMDQQRSYLLALSGAPALSGMYIDEQTGGLTLRQAGEYLLLGGQGHRTGVVPQTDPYAALRQAAQALYPTSQVEAAWSAQDCMSLDRILYAGTYARTQPDQYVASGFDKWGMTGSMVAAGVVARAIAGRPEPWDAAVSPRRGMALSGVPKLLVHGGYTLKGFADRLLDVPQMDLTDLPAGQAAVVQVGGKRRGAYRDEQGRVHLVSLRCPHMGCELKWNPQERSWDCPCHGSRFDYEGRLLDSPSTASIARLSQQEPQPAPARES